MCTASKEKNKFKICFKFKVKIPFSLQMSVGPAFTCGSLEEKLAFVLPYREAQHHPMTPARLRNQEP